VVDFAALRRVLASFVIGDWGRRLAVMRRCISAVLAAGPGGGGRELRGLGVAFAGWLSGWAVMFVVTVGDVVGKGGGGA